ncbi:hypothetical protein Lade_2119 [Legionella adelaidensis]|uniref:Uncharacterized protein n=1 Tax=Legionella adelaidensis TaxID=45056 RepID=A0A0W0R1I4_9GAMM|nr:hypothetical protein [Legionella adelaidensis]KTC64825.1 hypothetical protein Lade_2119 [Legionella adelaidensis]
MEKQFLSPLEMLKIAADHAYCAEYLLSQNGEVEKQGFAVDALLPIISLIHIAFELYFKACLLHEQGQIKAYKNMNDLLELNSHLGLAKIEKELIHKLSRQYAFRKGVDFALWKNRQELHVFCEQILSLYARIQTLIPVELQNDYQST